MSIFAISDLHLSFGVDKPMDIFKGWSNYIEKLKRNWTSVVELDDTVVIAGDISWALKLENSKEDFRFIDSLPGKKILIKGNHDYWWGTKAKMDKFFKSNFFNTLSILLNNAYEVEGLAICGTRGWICDNCEDKDKKILEREVCRLQASIDCANKQGLEPIVFLHYPPVYDSCECKEIMNVLISNRVKKCYYGHLHGKAVHNKAIIGNYKGVDLNLISCDYLNFMPMCIA